MHNQLTASIPNLIRSRNHPFSKQVKPLNLVEKIFCKLCTVHCNSRKHTFSLWNLVLDKLFLFMWSFVYILKDYCYSRQWHLTPMFAILHRFYSWHYYVLNIKTSIIYTNLPATMESFYKMKHLKASHMTEWLILVLSLFSIWKDI